MPFFTHMAIWTASTSAFRSFKFLMTSSACWLSGRSADLLVPSEDSCALVPNVGDLLSLPLSFSFSTAYILRLGVFQNFNPVQEATNSKAVVRYRKPISKYL